MRARLDFVGCALALAVTIIPSALAQEPAAPSRPPLLRIVGDDAAMPARLSAIEADSYGFDVGEGATTDEPFPEAPSPADLRTVRDEALIRWGLGVERPRQPLTSLVDGSVLAGELVALGTDALLLDSRLFGELSVPLGLVRGIAVRPPYDAEARDRQLARIVDYEGTDDALELVDGPAATGVWSPGPAPQASAGGPVPFGTKLDRFYLESADSAQPLDFARERVRELFVAPAARSTPADPSAGVWWGFEDGTLLRVVSRTVEGDVVRATLACDLVVTLDLADVLSRLKLIEPFGPATTALSELEPQAYRQTALGGREIPLGLDESPLGGRLRSGGGYVLSGIGMHARSRAVFAFDAAYRRFEAELAIHDSAVSSSGSLGGSIVGVVYLLRDGDWSQAVRTPVVRGGDAPAPVHIDVAGAQALMLVVEEADGGDILDRANWLDAKLWP